MEHRLSQLADEHGEADRLADQVELDVELVEKSVPLLVCSDCGAPTRIHTSQRTWRKKLDQHIEQFGCEGPFGLYSVNWIRVDQEED